MNKKIMVTKSSLPKFSDYVETIEKLWETRWLTNNGEFHTELEKNLKEYLLSEEIELFINGHMALDLCIKALKIEGEVITTPFTFASTTHALVMNNIKPVFCDIREDNFCIDENKVEELITEKTTAILAVHVYGQVCNNDKLEKIAQKYNLKLLYDGAHAFGVKVGNRGITSYGDATMYSFHATKVFHTIEGGALAFNKNETLKSELQKLKNFGITGPESVLMPGTNGKMNEFSAAMGLCNLKILKEEIEKRQKVVFKYIELLSNIKGIRLIDYEKNKKKGIIDNYSYLPIIIDEKEAGFTRDELFSFLETKNIYPRKYFYPLITDFECYKNKFKEENLDVAKYISNRVMTLPLYADLQLDEVKYICDSIINLYNLKSQKNC